MGKLALKQSLPDLPSQLIRTALADLNVVERTKGYVVDMGSWHDPLAFDRVKEKKVCAVCFAGSVMANTLKAKKSEEAGPENYSQLTRRKLRALDDFRMGDVQNAFHELKIENDTPDVSDRTVPEYENDKKGFKAAMKELAQELEAAGY